MKFGTLLLASLLFAGCGEDKPKPQTKFTATALVQHIEYHNDPVPDKSWYVLVLQSPEGQLWSVKLLYTYPPVWEGFAGDLYYEVANAGRGEYKNLVVLKRLK